MHSRKLQIFLSSTYTDLVDLRLAAIEAILAAGHIPATMEQFTPGDETALEVIERWVASSDAFILMLGGRYGSIEPNSRKSYVELEYELAVRLRKPLFAMTMSEAALQTRANKLGLAVADERENQSKYKAFRELVRTKLCGEFNDWKDVRSLIFQKLPEWAQRDELVGWVRGSDATSPQTADELVRLSRENADLRARLERHGPGDYDGVTFDELVKILREEQLSTAVESVVPRFLAKNTGLLFEHFLEQLAREEVLANNSADPIGIAMRTLEAHGLVKSDYQGGTHYYSLTQMGRRFRNRLLASGSAEQRRRDLWGAD